jgi:hypothetical protein
MEFEDRDKPTLGKLQHIIENKRIRIHPQFKKSRSSIRRDK